MSLFPAYSNADEQKSVDNNRSECLDKGSNSSEWLSNSSFQELPTNFFKSAENDIDPEGESAQQSPISEIAENVIRENADNIQSKSCKSSKLKHRKKENKGPYPWEESSSQPKYERQVKNLYFEDIYRNKKFLSLETLPPNLRPKYRLYRRPYGFSFHKPIIKNYQRYYVTNIDNVKKPKKKDSILKRTNKDKSLPEVEANVSTFENEQRLKTETFNRQLSEDPSNVQLWLEFAKFQDELVIIPPFRSEKENLIRNQCKKKLSIIEKGLQGNPDSVELLKTKLQLMEELTPIDDFCSELEVLIKKSPRNIVLWQKLIFSIQTSCALCKVSRMLDVYTRCFQALRVKARSNPKFFDGQILKMLYQCLSFLRHAGLWEQMWEIIRLNLSLNLDVPQEHFKNTKSVDEKKLIEMEEVILTSRLPLNQLWLRVESVRERCHWTSINPKEVDIDLIGDAKRLVGPDEVTEFIYPMYSVQSNFRLVVYFLLALKVPLLPTRHSTMKHLSLDELPWVPDSLEYLLPMLYTCNNMSTQFSLDRLITGLLEGDITAGPQLLKFHPTQDTFLEFIRTAFKGIAENLPSSQRTSIYIWWLRFERLLVFVVKNDPIKDESRNKKLKSIIKEFLKKSENRNNLHFYQEYALIERELGRFDNCIQILETIIQSHSLNSTNFEEKAAYCSLYRTLFECLLDSNTFKSTNISTLLRMAEGLRKLAPSYEMTLSIEELLQREITMLLENSAEDEDEKEMFLPNFYCDIVACYAYLSYARNFDNIDNFNHTINVLDECLRHYENCPRLKERFVETKVTVLQIYQQRTRTIHSHIESTLTEALKEFPNNFLLLSANAIIECELPMWKLKMKNGKIDLWSAISACLAGRSRIKYLEHIDLPDVATAVFNKLLSFHRTLSKAPDVQRCPLLWKLYMLLLREYNLCEKKGEEIYYEAVSCCPWSKSLYISAAEIAPQLLPQIQDIIREKELRIHVTPEELEILRG